MILYHAEHNEDIATITLDKEHLNTIREKFQFWRDADGFEINLTVTTKDLPLGAIYGIAGLKFTATIKQNGKIVKEYSGVKFSQNSDGTPNIYADGGPGCFHCTVEYRVR